MMKKNKKIYDIMLTGNVLQKLYEQQINYNANTAYKLFKLKKEINEIEEMMFQRWTMLFGKDYDPEKFTEDEIVLYNTTLSVDIEFDCPNIDINDVANVENVKISMRDIEILSNFLNT